IYSQNENEAINVINKNCGEFYKQKKYFERLKAKAYINLEKFDDALEVYRVLVTGRPDWWLLHEFGILLVKQKKVDEGFSYLIKAALSPPMKPELKVTLFSDLGSLLVQYKQPNHAIQHFKLAKAVRMEQGWKFEDLDEKIANLGGNILDQTDIRTLLRNCQEIWNGFLPSNLSSPLIRNKSTRGLTGKVTSLIKGRPFCFIISEDSQSYFCRTDDL